LEFCSSKTFFVARNAENIEVYGWSNSTVPQGMAAVCSQIFGGLSAAEIAGQTIDFHIKSGLIEHLTPLRAQSLLYMIKACTTLL
jgi:sulfur transfer protein SufE